MRVADSVHDDLRQQIATAQKAHAATESERVALFEQVATHEETIKHLNEQLRASTIALIVEKSLPGVTPEQLAVRLAAPPPPQPIVAAPPAGGSAPIVAAPAVANANIAGEISQAFAPCFCSLLLFVCFTPPLTAMMCNQPCRCRP